MCVCVCMYVCVYEGLYLALYYTVYHDLIVCDAFRSLLLFQRSPSRERPPTSVVSLHRVR